jgi:hypothetical protein
MRALRTAFTALLMLALGTSGFAGDLERSVAKAAEQEASRPPATAGSKAAVWAGTALFVGGMAVGLSSFINNKNGQFSEFGEANAVNKHLGAAGLSAAFAGGVLIFLGSHGLKHSPAVTVGAGQVTVSKQLSW